MNSSWLTTTFSIENKLIIANKTSGLYRFQAARSTEMARLYRFQAARSTEMAGLYRFQARLYRFQARL